MTSELKSPKTTLLADARLGVEWMLWGCVLAAVVQFAVLIAGERETLAALTLWAVFEQCAVALGAFFFGSLLLSPTLLLTITLWALAARSVSSLETNRPLRYAGLLAFSMLLTLSIVWFSNFLSVDHTASAGGLKLTSVLVPPKPFELAIAAPNAVAMLVLPRILFRRWRGSVRW